MVVVEDIVVINGVVVVLRVVVAFIVKSDWDDNHCVGTCSTVGSAV